MPPLPVPVGNQHKVIFLSPDQHHVVLGTAGTGKSTMAVLRAHHLSQQSTPNHGPVLLVTYNKTLVTYLRYLGRASQQGVTIETYGRFARGYLNAQRLMTGRQIAGPDQVRARVVAAISSVQQGHGHHSILERDPDWMIDEIHWLSGMGISTLDEYQELERIGRQTPLARGAARGLVWAVREHYRSTRLAEGYPYDWYDLATAVRETLEQDSSQRRYRHIVIDEGQDLSPEALRSLVAAVPNGGSLTFFGDYHQAIYGQGLSWQKSGIELRGRQVERFADNYRNTAQIAKVAIAMASSPYMTGEATDLVTPRAPRAHGPKPTMVTCHSEAREAQYVCALATEAGRDQTVAVLARTWEEARRATRGVQCTPLRESMGRWDTSPGIYFGAYHSAKGLEFDMVILPFLNDSTIPYSKILQAYATSEACAREARLLYVAVTRAKSTLVMTHSSPITRLLPANADLWDMEIEK